MRSQLKQGRGFTLVELLITMGIIALLIGMIVPIVSRARESANVVKCQSNLRQIGAALQNYVNDNGGWMYPAERGANSPREQRWPIFVLPAAVWNPQEMLCPSDSSPFEEHSYVINNHMSEKGIKWTSRDLGGRSSSELVIMGEKKSSAPDYYMEAGENFNEVVELYRHGPNVGSNYLFMDWHVASMSGNPQVLSGKVLMGIAPWDPWDLPSKSN